MIKTDLKVAFVCSGGAVKAGAFHMGVALALEEKGFQFAVDKNAKKKGPKISSYIGSSVGSLVATYLAAGYSPLEMIHSYLGKEEMERFLASKNQFSLKRMQSFKKMTYQQIFRLHKIETKATRERLKELFFEIRGGHWSDLFSMKWMQWSGFFSTSGIEKHIREDVLSSNRFEDYKADLFIVATPLDSAQRVIFSKYTNKSTEGKNYQLINTAKISDACAASTALPILFSPYKIAFPSGEVRCYIDGEIREALSSDVVIDHGADLVIASYIHQPYEMDGEADSLVSHGLPLILVQTIYHMVEQKIHQQIEDQRKGLELIDKVLEYCKSQGLSSRQCKTIVEMIEKKFRIRRKLKVIYIHPKPGDKALFFENHFNLSPKKMVQVIQKGYEAACEKLSELAN